MTASDAELKRRLVAEWEANGRRWERALARWSPPGVEAFNPALYALDLYARFLDRFPPRRGALVGLGLNPGPFGMAQTGIPFTDCRTAARLLGTELCLPGRAPAALERRLRREGGRWRSTYERSSLGVYRFLTLAWGSPEEAFRHWTVVNACPVLFLKEGDYKNMTPADGPLRRLEGFQELRREAVERFADILEPRGFVCLGKDVSEAIGPVAERLVGAARVVHYPHPARAVPETWARGLADEVRRRGLAQPRVK
jgi:single-strand selective monofunctional uracil DNA glycosylase